MKKLTIILDVDDTLMPCVEPAADIVREETGFDIRYENTTTWGFTNFPREIGDRMREVMASAEFHRSQHPFPGAVDMVRKLQADGHNIIIFSAVPPEAMGERSISIQKYFPIPSGNIVLGGNKNLMKADIMLDDGLHNIMDSQCRYPILFRRPWNMTEKRVLSVSSYSEFLDIVNRIAEAPQDGWIKESMKKRPEFIALVGPSASGKSTIIKELLRDPRFAMASAVTSRKPRGDEQNGEYHFVSRLDFIEMDEKGVLIEKTEYLGNFYGMSMEDVKPIWDEGKIPIRPMDINGAMAVKKAFGEKAVTIFIRRNKEAVLKALIERNSQTNDIVRRILNLDQEYANESLCDWTVSNDGRIEETVKQILQIVNH